MTVTEPTALPPASRRALGYPEFRAFLMQRMLTTFGVSIQSVVVGWQVYYMTNSTLNLGLVGLAQFAPNILLALYAGHLADRMDRRIMLRMAILAEFVCSVSLVTLTLTGNHSVWPIYATLVLFGAARAFMAPASQSIIPRLVHREALGGAIALGSSMFMVAQIAGPALGGALYTYGAAAAFIASGTFFLMSLGATFFIRTSLKPEAQLVPGARSILGGVRFIRQNPAILGAISLDLFAVLLGGATALLPVYVRDILQTGPQGLGLLRSAPAVGALAMSLVLARKSLGNHAGLDDVRGGRGLRARHHRLRRLDQFSPVAAGAGDARRVRHGQRVHALEPCAAHDPRRDAGARRLGQLGVHRRLERAGRDGVGFHCLGVRQRRGCRRRGRHRHVPDRGDLGGEIPGASARAAAGRHPAERHHYFLESKLSFAAVPHNPSWCIHPS